MNIDEQVGIIVIGLYVLAIIIALLSGSFLVIKFALPL